MSECYAIRPEEIDGMREVVPWRISGAGGEVKCNHVLVVAQEDDAALPAVLASLLRQEGGIVHLGCLDTRLNGVDNLLCSARSRDERPLGPVVLPQRIPKKRDATTIYSQVDKTRTFSCTQGLRPSDRQP